MHYVSTRDKAKRLTAAQAIAQGLSVDGGLLTPAELPKLTTEDLSDMVEMDYQQRAVKVMGRFLADFTAEELAVYADAAYGNGKFDHADVAPVVKLDETTHMLELWHGPTCAFKDMALQMLPHLLTASLRKNDEDRTVCILVATSGDTGKAALEGFKDVDQTRILVFYPKDGVSDIQQLQMITQEGNNVGVCSVVGNFDDAQTGVKNLFSDEGLRAELDKRGCFFSSANSINWGRVLPQIVYYVSAYCDLVKTGAVTMGQTVNVCVPTGNFGNILAAYYAKNMGVPLGRLICASNSNNVLTDFLTTGVYDRNRPFHTTTSPSMDILISSNLERLLYAVTGEDDAKVAGYMAQLKETGRYQVEEAVFEKIKALFSAGFCSDEEAAAVIAKAFNEGGYLMDPHTAVACHVLEEYRKETGDDTVALVVSTASPFKFCDSVLDALGEADKASGTAILDQLSQHTGRPAPKPLADLSGKEVRFTQCVPKEEMLAAVLGMLPETR